MATDNQDDFFRCPYCKMRYMVIFDGNSGHSRIEYCPFRREYLEDGDFPDE